jgi:hypothetical protein
MSIRFKNSPGTLAVLGLLLAVCMFVPPCFAGGAATIVLDKHQLAPRGSFIPASRVKRVLKKVEEHKAMMEQKKALQQEDQLNENTQPASKSPDEE